MYQIIYIISDFKESSLPNSISLYYNEMKKKRPLSREDYYFYREYKNKISNTQVLVKVLDCLRKNYFHYKTPITLPELTSIVSDTSNSYYKDFRINKKTGGRRLISAPNQRLKEIQNCIRILITGFYFRGKSITKNAINHVGKEVIYNIDIKDFYPSIDITKVLPIFLKRNYTYDVALFISLLVTKRSKKGIPVLPQGAPTSPAISNLVLRHLDCRLSAYASKHNLNYSRYVDDITFSCSKSQPWYFHASIFKRIISSEGFIVNRKKTRVSFDFQRQEVLGLTVNSRLNVPRKYIKNLRTILHNWEKDGYVKANNNFLLHYYKDMINPKSFVPKMEHVILGKLSYLKMVRNFKAKEGQIDSLWQKLHIRYTKLMWRDHSIISHLVH